MTDHRTLEAKILAMYLGQKAIAGTKEKTFTIIGVCSDSNSCSIKLTGRKGTIINEGVSISIIKPILRKLESMTEEEAAELLNLCDGEVFAWTDQNDRKKFAYTAQGFHYLLSRGFDLFGLIDSGLAIAQKGEGE